MEFQVHDGIDQLAHYYLSIAARRQSKRGNDGNALVRLHQRDLCIQEIDHDTGLPSNTCFRQMLVDELLVGKTAGFNFSLRTPPNAEFPERTAQLVGDSPLPVTAAVFHLPGYVVRRFLMLDWPRKREKRLSSERAVEPTIHVSLTASQVLRQPSEVT